jgi:uncharacterized protein (DUF488 family)
MARPRKADDLRLCTAGHGDRTIEEFCALLRHYAVTRVVDVRRVPRSAANPQFNADALAPALAAADCAYTPRPALAGWRKPQAGSANGGWRNASFRAYADYMQTPAFAAAVDELVALAQAGRLAIVCAERMPWRCHRSLIADALTARGHAVVDLVSESTAWLHELPSFARVRGAQVDYPTPGK